MTVNKKESLLFPYAVVFTGVMTATGSRTNVCGGISRRGRSSLLCTLILLVLSQLVMLFCAAFSLYLSEPHLEPDMDLALIMRLCSFSHFFLEADDERSERAKQPVLSLAAEAA